MKSHDDQSGMGRNGEILPRLLVPGGGILAAQQGSQQGSESVRWLASTSHAREVDESKEQLKGWCGGGFVWWKVGVVCSFEVSVGGIVVVLLWW